MTRWQEISLETNYEASEAAINVFYEIGAQGVVIEDNNVIADYIESNKWDCHEIPYELTERRDTVIIKGYFPADEQFEERLASFSTKIKSLGDFFKGAFGKISNDEIADEDWSVNWKKYFKTKRVSDKFVIKPEWENYYPLNGEIVLEVDPGSAFGTGTHPTTIMCLELIDKYLFPGHTVFDVGCGSGILTVASAKLGASHVYARDIDFLAVQASKKNTALNGLSSRSVTVEAGNLLDGVRERADIIMANLTADSILEFSPQAYQRLNSKGVFITSGIVKKRQEEVVKEIEDSGFTIDNIFYKDDWIAIAAVKD